MCVCVIDFRPCFNASRTVYPRAIPSDLNIKETFKGIAAMVSHSICAKTLLHFVATYSQLGCRRPGFGSNLKEAEEGVKEGARGLCVRVGMHQATWSRKPEEWGLGFRH